MKTPGVWFEEKRNRYRVKIVRNKQRLHLSYHRDRNEAMNTLEMLKATIDPKTSHFDRLLNQTRLYFSNQVQRRYK